MLDILKALNSIVETWNVSCFGISSFVWLIFSTSQFLLSWKCQFLFWNWSFRWHNCARKFLILSVSYASTFTAPSAINISYGSNIWPFFASTIWQLLKATINAQSKASKAKQNVIDLTNARTSSYNWHCFDNQDL